MTENGHTIPEAEKFQIEDNPSSAQGAGDKNQTAKWRQFYSAFPAHLGAWIMATVWSWSSTALPSLRESHESIGHLTMWQEAWIASITFLAGAAGSLVVGPIAQKFGLKTSLIIATFPLLGGWLLITFAANIEMILIGRFITGFCVAGVGVSTSLVAEFSKPSRRGRLNFIFDMQFCIGVLYIYIIGTFTPWKVQAGLCAAICVIFFFALLSIPESPKCLIMKGQDEEAKKALKWVRNSNDVGEEFNMINSAIAEEDRANAKNVAKDRWRGHFTVFFTKSALKPIFICICLQFFLQVCGVVPIVCYAVDVFKAAGTVQVHENVSTIVLGAINLIATCVAFFFVDRAGRRKLLIGSEIVLTLTLAAIGIFLYFKDGRGDGDSGLDSYSWFLLGCFVIFITAYSFGVGPLPWVVMGEIVSPQVKGVSNGVVILATRIFGFFVMFYFKDMILLIGQHGVYWFFAVVCCLGALFTYFMLPETKNRTLEEIQQDLARGWFYHRRP